MRDNEFEKGVQEKMEEFRLPPSAPVWMEVERRIRERKRRRILIFWFCLAGLLTAGLGGWWIQQSENQTDLTHKTLDDHQPSVAIPGEESIEKKPDFSHLEKNKTASGKPGSPASEVHSTLKEEESLSIESEAGHEKGIVLENKRTPGEKTNSAKAVTHDATRFITGTGKKSAAAKTTVKDLASDARNTKNPGLTKKTEVAPATIDGPSVPVSIPAVTALVDSPVAVQSATTVAMPADTIQSVRTEQAQVVTPTVKPLVKKGKWQTGLVFAFGESKLTEGGLNVFLNKSLNFDQLQSGSVSGNNGNGTFSNQSFADSIPLKGPAFHAGFFAKRKAGKKTAFSAGLNFAYYSGKQRVGAQVDSVRLISSPFNTTTSEGFYRSGSSARYTNRYYYIQLPLLLHWQINKGEKGPSLEWENGIVPSFMMANRALVYDRAGQIFFLDKSVYNQFSLVYQTGFTATFASRTKHPLTAGLYYNYHFSRLQKTNPPDFNHLSSYGIQFRWLLKK